MSVVTEALELNSQRGSALAMATRLPRIVQAGLDEMRTESVSHPGSCVRCFFSVPHGAAWLEDRRYGQPEWFPFDQVFVQIEDVEMDFVETLVIELIRFLLVFLNPLWHISPGTAPTTPRLPGASRNPNRSNQPMLPQTLRSYCREIAFSLQQIQRADVPAVLSTR